MSVLTDRATRLTALCCAVYFISYLTRKCYEASILAICDDTGMARTAAGLAATATVMFYGAGQLITGWLADRMDPRKIILSALLLTAACNASMPWAAGTGMGLLVAVNALNGFAQAMFWPPLVKIVSVNLSADRFKSAVFWINAVANIAIIVVFALVSLCVRFAGWRWSFAAVTVAALAMAATWALSQRKMGPHPTANATDKSDATIESKRSGLPPGAVLLPILGAIVCIGALRDGIEAWAPGIVKDVYGLSTSSSVLSVALLPVFAVASMAGARVLRRRLGDEVRAAIVLFALGFSCAAALFATGGATMSLGLPLLALLSAAMHGANLMLVGELPGRFANGGRVGLISGILNAGVYVGAALSMYGFPALREHFAGWTPVFAIWTATLAIGAALAYKTLLAARSLPGGAVPLRSDV